MSEINTEPYDAQQIAEEIAAGDRPAPVVNVSDDYETAQEFSTSSIDSTSAGVDAAEAATASQFEAHSPEETELSPGTLTSDSTGAPEDYLDMAREVHPTEGATGNVDDDLLQKAFELGKPGES